MLAATLGRFDEALALERRAIDLDPLSAFIHGNFGLTAYYVDRFDEAISACKKALELTPGGPNCHAILGLVYLRQNRLQESLPEMGQEPDPWMRLYGHAFEWLERAYAHHDGGLTFIKGDPLLKNIEHDPRYIPFLKKMHLPV